jgi:hypothetical protein
MVAEGITQTDIPAARVISGACTMCHNYWENFKWFGVTNYSLNVVELDNPTPPKDIYGNYVSPYGLASTKSYVMEATQDGNGKIVSPWTAGLDTYQYTDVNDTVHTRLDYVWSNLSAVSPGPVLFNDTSVPSGCGTAEEGLCHGAVDAVALSFEDLKPDFPEFPNGTNVTSAGAGVFFTHEMAFTTAQYAAKPVKICGACHVFKLPPMQWGGEPWAITDVKYASANGALGQAAVVSSDVDNPFGFRPSYNDLTGEVSFNNLDGQELFVRFRTPDWAHANVPCIRCHVHAGISGETVSDNPSTP